MTRTQCEGKTVNDDGVSLTLMLNMKNKIIILAKMADRDAFTHRRKALLVGNIRSHILSRSAFMQIGNGVTDCIHSYSSVDCSE